MAAARALQAIVGPPIRTLPDDWHAFGRVAAVRAVDPPIVMHDDDVHSQIGDRRSILLEPPSVSERLRHVVSRPPWDRLARAWNSGIPLRVRGVAVIRAADRHYRRSSAATRA